MKISFDVTQEQLQQLLNVTKDQPNLSEIHTHILDAIANADDEQRDEVSKEGDNAIIDRFE
ncbi:hypothetical protein ACFQZX_00685 [Mucilaginibacter litoreus]|uniref:Uncharacterized protein n=1 Tax=Mucilaginibacter litoreus TaxID=1048221 RepID=A0ABW3AM77_9SPHI